MKKKKIDTTDNKNNPSNICPTVNPTSELIQIEKDKRERTRLLEIEYQQDTFLSDMRLHLKEVQEKFKDDPNAKYGNRHPKELKAIAVALRASGMPYTKIAFVLKVGTGTVHHWVNSPGQLGDGRYQELAEQVKDQLANRSYLLSNTILANITDEDMKKAPLGSKVMASAILIDKARLLDGESTENQSIYIKKSVEIKSSIAVDKKILEELDESIALLESDLSDNKDKL